MTHACGLCGTSLTCRYCPSCASAGTAKATPAQLAGPDAIIAKARRYEEGNDYARAIETYLSLTTEVTSNLDVLEQVRGEQAAVMPMLGHVRV